MAGAVREVADLLGNTPAVARNSYVDPRVVEAYTDGDVIDATSADPPAEAEKQVRALLTED